MALPFNFANNPLVGANPLTPTYPTTGGPLPEFRTTGGPLPMATGGMQPMATGSMSGNPYLPTSFGSPASSGNPYLPLPFSQQTGSTGSTGGSGTYTPLTPINPIYPTGNFSYDMDAGRNTVLSAPETKTFDWQGNRYSMTFPAGTRQIDIDRALTNFVAPGVRTFDPSQAIQRYYSQQAALQDIQNLNAGQRSTANRLESFMSKMPNYTVNFMPGSESALNPFYRAPREISDGMARKLERDARGSGGLLG